MLAFPGMFQSVDSMAQTLRLIVIGGFFVPPNHKSHHRVLEVRPLTV